MWFDVEAVPLSFIESAPYRFENTVLLDAPPARVFEIWANAEAQKDWFQDFVENRWKSAVHGVGAEREVELKLLTVRERFLIWEPGKRMAFTIYGITLPLVKAMVEDITLEPVGDRATRMVWRAHYTPSLLMKMIHPLGRKVGYHIYRRPQKVYSRWLVSCWHVG